MGQTMNSVTFLLLLHVYVAYNDIYLYNIPRSFVFCDRSWNYISGIN